MAKENSYKIHYINEKCKISTVYAEDVKIAHIYTYVITLMHSIQRWEI